MAKQIKEVVARDPSDNHKPSSPKNRIPDSEFEKIAAAPEDKAPDPFDMDALRLTQDFASAVGVKRVLTTVPCRKPNRHEFIRVRPGDDWRLETVAFEDKVSRETYLVVKGLWDELAGDVQPYCLRLTITRQGHVFLWPVKLPSSDGRSNHWNDSAMEAAALAETSWIRLAANMRAGMYDTFQATGELPDPEWPELSFKEILQVAFRDRFIQSPDHPMLQSLRGEA